MKIKPNKSVKRIGDATSFRLNREDVMGDLTEKKGSSLFLGKYSVSAVVAVLEKKGFLKEARKKNLWPLVFELDSSEFPPLQRFQIFFGKKDAGNLIVDLKLSEFIFRSEDYLTELSSYPAFKMLFLEWLTLQNPLIPFVPQRPPLPGQAYQGLKLGKKILDIFTYLARINHEDGILAFPCYFHNALLFSRVFMFFSPEKQGEVLAIRKSFRDVPFVRLAWAIHLNCMRTEDGTAYEWKAEEQVYPMNKALKKHFESKRYKDRVKAAAENRRFSIDWDCYEKKFKSEYEKLNLAD